ncbi:MAG: hypothetical protein C0459_12485 [Chitinophaga sp.]|jgi:cell division protein ZapA (FtsZ GTPase activity inhibitor)|nr:hypothetical protein [Chitinophaga sp.]
MWLIFILAIVVLYLFFSLNKSNKNRRSNNRARYRDKQEELLQILREKNNKELKDEVEKGS